jgi:hypothetical protein
MQASDSGSHVLQPVRVVGCIEKAEKARPAPKLHVASGVRDKDRVAGARTLEIGALAIGKRVTFQSSKSRGEQRRHDTPWALLVERPRLYKIDRSSETSLFGAPKAALRALAAV